MTSIAGLVLYGSTAGISAAAAGTMGTTGTTAGVSHRFCFAQAEPVGSTNRPVATCYSSFSRMIFAATNGRVSLPASTRPGSVTPDEINALATPASSFVLSFDFDGTFYTGAVLTWVASAKCGTFFASSMPSGWNDVISSVAPENGCASRVFVDVNFEGNSFSIPKSGSTTLGNGLNNAVSSQIWCPTYPC